MWSACCNSLFYAANIHQQMSNVWVKFSWMTVKCSNGAGTLKQSVQMYMMQVVREGSECQPAILFSKWIRWFEKIISSQFLYWVIHFPKFQAQISVSPWGKDFSIANCVRDGNTRYCPTQNTVNGHYLNVSPTLQWCRLFLIKVSQRKRYRLITKVQKQKSNANNGFILIPRLTIEVKANLLHQKIYGYCVLGPKRSSVLEFMEPHRVWLFNVYKGQFRTREEKCCHQALSFFMTMLWCTLKLLLLIFISFLT